MSKKVTQALWLVSGILLLFAGVVAMLNPGGAIDAVVFVLGLAVILAGAFDLVIFFSMRRSFFGANWVLIEGILTVLVALFLLLHPQAAAAAIPYVFGMWVLMTGISRAVTSFDLKELGFSKWWGLTIAGIVGILVGFLSFFKPDLMTTAAGVLIGVFLMVQGLASLFLWFVATKFDEQSH